MLLQVLGFLHMSFADVLDVLMVALIIYFVFRWIRGSAAMNIFIALLLLFVVLVVVEALGMKLMSAILGTFIDVGVIALIVIFQPEVRHFLIRIGGRNNISRLQFIGKLFGARERRIGSEAVSEIVEACVQMSSDKTGALIVIPHTNPLQYIIETGDRISIGHSGKPFEIVTGDIVTITTATGNKHVTLTHDGQTSEVNHYLTEDSIFVQLMRGSNSFGFNADSGLNNMSISIAYTFKYARA